ncbi:MAG TPA: DUF58 domain-containing protein [Oceanithermus profundus]|uniref:DUF58 domain-containing protein n=1 Tax=Oceanithermus profundus TaxID=187137 RepID=A0A7C4Z5V6_9DEIN|nr:DUF58 domain-containing protein [Oceanithermus profundus]
MFRYRIRTPLRRPQPGGRKSRRAGESLDFMELRGYAPGDDPRFVDWKAYARTGRLYTRVWEGEERVRFTLWLDGSPSMRLFGKEDFAREVARVLLAAALPDETHALGAGSLRRLRSPLELRRYAADARGPAAARTELAHARGQLLLVTDGLDETDWAALLRRLAPRRPLLVQVLAPEELDPPPRAEEWRDVETGERVHVDAAALRAWRKALAAHLRTLQRAAAAYGGYAHLRVGEPIVPALRRQGVLEWR